MTPVTLTGQGYAPEHFDALATAGFDARHISDDAPRDELLDALATSRMHILGGAERFGPEEFDAAPMLRAISFVGTGYGAFVDADIAARRGIRICNTPGVMAPAVAEHTIGLMLAAARCVTAHNNAARSPRAGLPAGIEISTATVGVLGMGAIGERLSRMLVNGFGARVVYHSRSRKSGLENELGLRHVSLDELFSRSSIVALLVPTSPQTRHLVDARLLALMQRDALLINTAGAQVVEPGALRVALETGRLRTAAFDGYYTEPLPAPMADPWGLLSLPDHRFVVTPHIAASTPATWRRMLDAAVRNAIEHGKEAT